MKTQLVYRTKKAIFKTSDVDDQRRIASEGQTRLPFEPVQIRSGVGGPGIAFLESF